MNALPVRTTIGPEREIDQDVLAEDTDIMTKESTKSRTMAPGSSKEEEDAQQAQSKISSFFGPRPKRPHIIFGSDPAPELDAARVSPPGSEQLTETLGDFITSTLDVEEVNDTRSGLAAEYEADGPLKHRLRDIWRTLCILQTSKVHD